MCILKQADVLFEGNISMLFFWGWGHFHPEHFQGLRYGVVKARAVDATLMKGFGCCW